ncbi:hypothetical protein ACHAQA_005163 [Verticillium albo-atrum]
MRFTAATTLLLAAAPLAIQAKSNGTITHPTSDSKLDLNTEDRSMNITWTYEGDTEYWQYGHLLLHAESRNETDLVAEFYRTLGTMEFGFDVKVKTVVHNATKGVDFLDADFLLYPQGKNWTIRYGVRYSAFGKDGKARQEDEFYSEPVPVVGKPYDGEMKSGGVFSAGRSCVWAGGVVALAAWMM